LVTLNILHLQLTLYRSWNMNANQKPKLNADTLLYFAIHGRQMKHKVEKAPV
jgi:hypothetical protein